MSNVCSVLQVGRLYDSSLLSTFCIEFLMKNFTEIEKTDDYKELIENNPGLKEEIQTRIAQQQQHYSSIKRGNYSNEFLSFAIQFNSNRY